MISFSVPDNGWVEVSFTQGSRISSFSVSDVGPDTIGQFVDAVAHIKAEESKFEVECYLEPSLLNIVLTPANGFVQVALILDSSTFEVFDFERSALISQLESELDKLIPLCVSPNWTHQNW